MSKNTRRNRCSRPRTWFRTVGFTRMGEREERGRGSRVKGMRRSSRQASISICLPALTQIKKLLAAQEAAVEVLRRRASGDDDLPGKFRCTTCRHEEGAGQRDPINAKVILSGEEAAVCRALRIVHEVEREQRPDVRYLALKRGANGAMIPVAMPMPLLEPGMTDELVNEVGGNLEQAWYPGRT